MTDVPPDVQHRIEAEIAAFQAALIDAEIEYVGQDTEYVPDSPRLQKQMDEWGDE